MLLLLINIAAFAQSIKITGVVKDNKGATLPGVSVKVKGTTIGSLTDIDGKYSINAPNSQAVLVFSYISYVSKEVTVGNNKTIDVTLLDATTDLNEVVVTGFGETVKKSDLTGAVGTVSAKQIEQRQPVNIFEALQGQVAGALVVTDNGDPNGTGTIQIRGISSINSGNGPLYIIDGVTSDNANFVNPADIASIEVLKDGASTSIYGARGANGVILITTKRGKEGKPQVNGNYYINFGNLAHLLPTVSSKQLRYYRAYRGDSNNGGNVDSMNHYLNADNDYQQLLFKQGVKQVAGVSISGGSKGLTYYTGVNYTDDKSIIINSYGKKLQTKINVDYQPGNFRIFNSLTFAYQTGNTVPLFNTLRQLFERNPWTSIFKPDGTYAGYIESKRNPVAQALFSTNADKNYTAQYSTQASYQISKDFKATILFNAQLDNFNNTQLNPSSLTSGGTGLSTGGNDLENKFYWETQGYLNYNHTFGKDHAVSAVAVVSMDRQRNDEYNIKLNNYLSEAILNPSAATILTTSTFPATAHTDQSVFTRLGYSYKSRYIAQGTYRRDGSSRFGVNNVFGNFFSGSVAWRFSDEKFMNFSKSWLDDAKFRASIGQTGNDQIGDYNSYTLMNFGDSYGDVPAAYINTTLGNSTIKWENVVTKNLGMDLTFFKGRLTITPEYYIKTTTGLLYTKDLPQETGEKVVTVNLGSIQNKGWEFTVSGTPIQTKNVRWNMIGNISFQRGKILSLADHTSFISGNKWLIEEGGKIGNFYLNKNLGVYQYDVSNAYTPDNQRLTPVGVSNNGTTAAGYTLNGQPYTGTIKQKTYNGVVLQGGDTEWLDANNDGQIDDADKVIAGNGLPNYFFGITNNISYKQFNLSFLFNGQIGNMVYNTTANAQNAFTSTYSPPTVDAVLTSWQNEGDISKYPLFTRKDTRGSIRTGYNSLYLEDGSFIRLSSARFTYTLDSKYAQKIKARNASVYVYGSNIFTWTNYSWFDPEFTNSNPIQPGEDTGRYPKRREFGVGITLNF
ncbi:TonB-dependent receptor [Mucilaginibacter mali]|uniref:TonB-dependent receptor n=2 Tax=Mucilaginibacter mali TaxID=2740462 RepID=A0A7D4UMT5_9SPHI|nr:TonB-dependent receptor [Mucilaginibacter mali]